MPDQTLTPEELQKMVTDGVAEAVGPLGQALQEAQEKQTNALVEAINQFRATQDPESSDPSVPANQQAQGQLEERFAELEAEYQKLRQQIAESHFQPVEEGQARSIRWPLEPVDLTSPPEDDATLAGQRLNDQLYTLGMLMAPDGEKPTRELMRQTLLGTKTLERAKRKFGKAIDTVTSGQGLEWVPTGYSNQMIEAVFMAARVQGLFPTINMPTPTYIAPVQLARPKAYKATQGTNRTESTEDLTDDVTFTAKSIAVYVPVTQEATEDMFLPIISWLMGEMAAGLGDGIEACHLNGDVTATHMDYDIEQEGDDDVQTCWDGLRHYGMGQTGCNVDINAWTADVLVSMKKAMGKYGIDPDGIVWIVGPGSLNDLLLLRDSQNNLLITTLDKYGPAATVITGEVAKLFGVAVVPSAFQREDVAATGYNTLAGPNTFATIMLVNRRAWFNGDRKNVTLETDKNIVSQVHQIVASWRGDLQHVYAIGEKTTICGYNKAA